MQQAPSDVQSRLTAAGMPRVAAQLAALARPSIRITTTVADDTAIAAGASKFGGAPDLPTQAAWPQWRGVPMAFVAQIRLADVAPADVAHMLPPTGLLSFFYDAQQQTYGDKPTDAGGWQVLYISNDAKDLHRQPLPAALPADARFQACALSFATELTLPPQPSLEDPTLKLTSAETKAYEALLTDFPVKNDQATIHNRMLGYTNTLQDDMRLQCQLVTHGVTSISDPRAAALTPGANEWLLLLQVDSDEHANMNWASVGMLYFWIPRDALAAKDFTRVWAVLQST
jgi:uncharacterized protein YwqG